MALKPPEEKTALQRYLPIVDWLPKYDWGGSLRFDLIAALTVWALLVPEAMAYAGIAGVSPEVGLVTAPLALIGYAIFGSSKHLFVGPSSTVAIISASVVAPLAGSDGDLYLILTIWLAIFTGVFFVGLGLARMGWIANFMATSVLSRLHGRPGDRDRGRPARQDPRHRGRGRQRAPGPRLDARAVQRLGLADDRRSVLSRWPRCSPSSGSCPRLPGALVVMLAAIALSAILDWEGGGIHVVGEIPAELPRPGDPRGAGAGRARRPAGRRAGGGRRRVRRVVRGGEDATRRSSATRSTPTRR